MLGFLEYRNGMAGARQLLSGRKSGGAGTNHGDALAGAVWRKFGNNPAFFPRAVDDGLLDIFDGDRGLVDAEHARRLTGSGTNAPGEFREIVGRVQHAAGFAPTTAPYEVVPVGNDVGDGAAGVAERDAAIHTPRTLEADLFFGERVVDFKPVVDALGYRAALRNLALVFEKTGDFTHGAPGGIRRPRLGG